MALDTQGIGSRDRHSYSPRIDVRAHEGILAVVKKVVEELGGAGVFVAAGECWPELLWRAGKFEEMGILTKEGQFSVPERQLPLSDLCAEKEGFRKWLNEAIVPLDMGTWLVESGEEDLTPDAVKALIWEVIADAVAEVRAILVEDVAAKGKKRDEVVDDGPGMAERSDVKKLGEVIAVGDKIAGSLFVGKDGDGSVYAFFEIAGGGDDSGRRSCYFFASPLIRFGKHIPVNGKLSVRGLGPKSPELSGVTRWKCAIVPAVATLVGFFGGAGNVDFVVEIEPDVLEKQLASPRLFDLPVKPTYDSYFVGSRSCEADKHLPYKTDKLAERGPVLDSFMEVNRRSEIEGELLLSLELRTNDIDLQFKPRFGSKCAYCLSMDGETKMAIPWIIIRNLRSNTAVHRELLSKVLPFIEKTEVLTDSRIVNFAFDALVTNFSAGLSTSRASRSFDFDVKEVRKLLSCDGKLQ